MRWLAACMLAVLGLSSAIKAQTAPLQVLATTSILADIATRVAGDYAAVTALLPPDSDAHAYEPATQDALRLSNAGLLLTVGAGYETFVQRLLGNAGANVPVIEANERVAILALGAAAGPEAGMPIGLLGVNLICGAPEAGAAPDEALQRRTDCDPHTWMNPLNVIVWAQNIAEALAAADPAHADAYRENAELYSDELQALDAEIAALVERIPPEDRRLVTNHENLQYFAARYGFELIATILPGGSSESEPDPQTLAAVIQQIQAQSVAAIFAETTANTAFAQVVAADAGVQLVDGLYIEALSAPDGPAPTYLDLMRYNAGLIISALGPA